MRVFRCRVLGQPVPQGRPRAFVRVSAQPGAPPRVGVYDPEASRTWKQDVRAQVVATLHREALTGFPWGGAISLNLQFFLIRPRSAPKRHIYPAKRPDLDNLVKAIKDALRGIVYRDDAQVVALVAEKRYVMPPGVEIVMEGLEEPALSLVRPRP